MHFTVNTTPMVEVGIPRIIIYLNHLRNDTEKLLHEDVKMSENLTFTITVESTSLKYTSWNS